MLLEVGVCGVGDLFLKGNLDSVSMNSRKSIYFQLHQILIRL